MEVPAQIDRIAPAGHTATQVLLTMAPEKMVTLSQELSDDQAKYLGESYAELPVTGAAFGAKGDLNKEAVAASGTQILSDTGELKDNIAEDLDTLQEQLGIPVVMIETTMDTYADAYEMLGELLGMEERGRELSEYCKSAYRGDDLRHGGHSRRRARARGLSLGDKGTNTIAKNSYQGQVVDLVANNVADLGEVSGAGRAWRSAWSSWPCGTPSSSCSPRAASTTPWETTRPSPIWTPSRTALLRGAHHAVELAQQPADGEPGAGHAVAAAPSVPRSVR